MIEPTPQVASAAAAWGVELVEPTAVGAWAWFGVRRQPDDPAREQHVVVKSGAPGDRVREATALRSFTHGATACLAVDADLGAILVERVILGDDLLPLQRADDDAATRAIGAVITQLHRDQASAGPLPELRQIAECFERPRDPRVPAYLVDAARALVAELTGDDLGAVLHGDLQHVNVLRRSRPEGDDEWVAIDPHGWLGDPAFDTAAMMANPRTLTELVDARGMDPVGAARRAERRAAVICEVAALERDRVTAWAFAAGVISELWMLEDHDLVHGAPLALAMGLRDRIR